MKIYVGNFGYELTDDEIKAAFESYGEVTSATIILDRNSGRSKGFGFVEMPEREQALAAIEALDGTELGGRTIAVSEARPKPVRDDRRGGFGGGYRGGSGGRHRGGSGGRRGGQDRRRTRF